MGVFVVQPPPPITDRLLFINFGEIFMDGSGGRVAQSFQSFQKIVNHCQHKILLIQTLLLLKQASVCNMGIHHYQIKYMEHDCHPNVPDPNRMIVIINQLV